MSAENTRWRRRFRESHEELKKRVADFNRELDAEIISYVDKVQECHEKAKESIIEAIRVVTDIIKEEDDKIHLEEQSL
eukprot:9276895-Karenia_brevis.AAC.1